jgi:hypothetical protein
MGAWLAGGKRCSVMHGGQCDEENATTMMRAVLHLDPLF